MEATKLDGDKWFVSYVPLEVQDISRVSRHGKKNTSMTRKHYALKNWK